MRSSGSAATRSLVSRSNRSWCRSGYTVRLVRRASRSWAATEADLRAVLANAKNELTAENRTEAEHFLAHNELGLAWATIVEGLGGNVDRVIPESDRLWLQAASDRMGGSQNLP